MDYLFPCLCCLIIGALGGFAGGHRVASLVLTRRPAVPRPVEQAELRVATVDGQVLEDFT